MIFPVVSKSPFIGCFHAIAKFDDTRVYPQLLIVVDDVYFITCPFIFHSITMYSYITFPLIFPKRQKKTHQKQVD